MYFRKYIQLHTVELQSGFIRYLQASYSFCVNFPQTQENFAQFVSVYALGIFVGA